MVKYDYQARFKEGCVYEIRIKEDANIADHAADPREYSGYHCRI